MVKLRDQKETDDKMAKHVLFRQNEDKQLVIHVKLPERGLYALDLYGKRWDEEGSTIPQISAYLIAATAGVQDQSYYPEINNQQAGQRQGNIP